MSELQYLYGLYLTLPVITQGFIAVIGVLTILIVGPFYNNRTVIFGPTVLTMLGIFGCFLGIVIGLLTFNTSEVSFDEITRLDDGTLGYKDSRVLVYIRDVSTYGGQLELPRFHVAYCSTLEKMRESNRFERYVVATREDGSFQINKIENGRKRGSSWEQLTICQNCLNALSFDSFSYRLAGRRRQEIVRRFTIARFFEQFPKTLHLRRPRHDYISAPVNEYSPGFSEAAKGYKAQIEWKCDKCGLDFSALSERRFLHVHHKNGLKYDDSPDNWRALCLGCHAEEPQHIHMKRPDNFKEFQKKYGRQRSAALQSRR